MNEYIVGWIGWNAWKHSKLLWVTFAATFIPDSNIFDLRSQKRIAVMQWLQTDERSPFGLLVSGVLTWTALGFHSFWVSPSPPLRSHHQEEASCTRGREGCSRRPRPSERSSGYVVEWQRDEKKICALLCILWFCLFVGFSIGLSWKAPSGRGWSFSMLK